jgi:tetratricopeptide (TPR) repeat protein
LSDFPEAALIYAPPRFHLGQILMEAGRYAEAADCFQSALSGKEIPAGKFLAWRGDALTLAGKNDTALKCYLTAFLDDPFTVEIQSAKNLKVINLHTSLHFEATDEIEEEQEPAWLPVWGWLQGVFQLPLQPAPEMTPPDAAEFEARLREDGCSVPRLWFDLLTQAERLRVTNLDDREMAAVRRLMKRTNGFMFDWYLQKIRTRG